MKKVKLIKIDKKEWVSFTLTLIATLVGVFLAISLTNSGIKEKEKKDTIKLLQSAKSIVLGTGEYAQSMKEAVDKLVKDSIKYNNDEAIDKLELDNPIPYPEAFETIISNELVAKNVSEFSYNYLFNSILNLRKLTHYNAVTYYKSYLEEIAELLQLEIAYQKGKIEEEDIETRFDSFKEKHNDRSQEKKVEIKT
ncbi:hypothetical protein [Tenacibaculum amylolyticum]|uniref:hypothetical protein n=1 Tax=Tenacibaculum amylolyticum TaxID=104269 RepID=UPI003893E7B7